MKDNKNIVNLIKMNSLKYSKTIVQEHALKNISKILIYNYPLT